MKRTLIIGDVHGCLRELKELLKRCSYSPKEDRLIFVGDLINRGPDSLGVVKLVRSLKAESVLGNHEVALLKLLTGKLAPDERGNLNRMRLQLGGKDSFWTSWLKSLPPFIEEKKFIVVHAGVVPEYPLAKTPLNVLTKLRYWDGKIEHLSQPSGTPWYDLYRGKKLIVYGHWSQDGLRVRKNTIGLDSGCVWGGKLSALILPDGDIFQVPAEKQYFQPFF